MPAQTSLVNEIEMLEIISFMSVKITNRSRVFPRNNKVEEEEEEEGRKEGRKSLFGKVYINWWYLQYNNFSLGDHTKTAVRSLS